LVLVALVVALGLAGCPSSNCSASSTTCDTGGSGY
jgi:hypothetical protein